ncbi:acetyltransferase [Desulfosporosinus sp. I2]|uniref:GNAT family N-acetyltransferase n=1 Tax=Desulfosporosinus sp. I2 TaxID=1617025 RepID=UPI0005EE6BD4|nr:GNAT family N-acetyltransferase [Desulfosporosinus sp. I2]KJR45548.1 acetyltransferase [Desulfosporosinus sp. I2]
MNVDILKTNSQNDDFVKLISLLDDDLDKRYGELQKQYEKHNGVAQINEVVIIYRNKIPVACRAFKEQDSNSVELKRIFVVNDQRGQGLAKLIVSKLEEIAKSRGYKYAVLETGIKQHEAINLYKSCGYCTIANYEPYTENTNSVCMKKNL